MEPKTATDGPDGEGDSQTGPRSVCIFAYSFFAPLWENSGGLAIIFYYFTASPIDRLTTD